MDKLLQILFIAAWPLGIGSLIVFVLEIITITITLGGLNLPQAEQNIVLRRAKDAFNKSYIILCICIAIIITLW